MNIYNCFIIFYCFISPTNADEALFYLTKNATKKWFKNFTNRLYQKNPYCLICCIDTSTSTLAKVCGKHTMCIYQTGMSGPGCKGFLDIPFVQEEVDVILDAHNTIRNKVALGNEDRGNPGPQPMASNMRKLEWDADLALVAHRWAAQCIFAHDLCRDTLKYPVGQNIAKGNFAINSDMSFIVGWYDLVQYVGEDDINSFQYSLKSPLRQYTQLVWAETYQIGCARVVFQQTQGRGNTSYHEHFICNYGPMGNLPGQPVYKVGEPCSNCPEGTGCTLSYEGLCGSEIDVQNLDEMDLKPIKKRPFKGLHISCSDVPAPFHFCFYFFINIFIIFY